MANGPRGLERPKRFGAPTAGETQETPRRGALPRPAKTSLTEPVRFGVEGRSAITQPQRPVMPNSPAATGKPRFGAPSEGEEFPTPASDLAKFGKGLLVGITQDPFIGGAVEKFAESLPGTDDETIQRMAQDLEGSKLSQVGEFVGKYGPLFIGGAGAFSLGGRAALGAASRAGVNVFGKTALTAAGRTAQIAGRSSGIGAFDFTRAIAGGESVSEAAKHAAVGASLTVGGELMFLGLGAAISRRARIRSEVAQARLLQRPEFRQSRLRLIEAEADAGEELVRLNKELQTAFGTPEVVDDILRSQGKRAGAVQDPKKVTAFKQTLAKQRQALTRKRALKELRETSDDVIYTRDKPFNPEGTRLLFAKFNQAVARTPESFQGDLGVTFGKFFKQWRDAETLTEIAADANNALIRGMMEKTRKAMGLSAKQADKGDDFLPLLKAWETGDEAGVRQFMQSKGRSKANADSAVEVLNDLDEAMWTSYQQLERMGAVPALTKKELQSQGLRRFFPHVKADLGDQDFVSRLAKSMGGDEAKAAQIMEAGSAEGLGKFGSIDFQRLIPGSLSDKISQGMPFNSHMFDGALQYLNASHRRFNYGTRFGFHGELGKDIVESVVKEGGSRALTSNMVDMALGHKWYDQSMREFARTVTGFQAGSKLALAVLANFTQPINTVADFGFRRFAHGAYKATIGESRDDVLRAVALSESVTKGVAKAFGESKVGSAINAQGLVNRAFANSANAADTYAQFVLKYTGFTKVEQMNRVTSGYTALYTFRDWVRKGVQGTLKGPEKIKAARSMQDLGIDLDDVISKARKNDNYFTTEAGRQIEQFATFRGAQRSQFIPGKTRRPLFWNHPAGRVMFQFKTFALGQGRFMRDRIFTEAARGNVRPLAYFMSLYPAAGEVVTDMRNIVRGKDRDDSGINRYLWNITAVGGLGIVTDGLSQARFGKALEFAAGPSISQGADFVNNLAQGDPGGIMKDLMRLPVVTATRRLAEGAVLGGLLLNEAVQNDEVEENSTSLVDFQRQQLNRRKGRQ